MSGHNGASERGEEAKKRYTRRGAVSAANEPVHFAILSTLRISTLHIYLA